MSSNNYTFFQEAEANYVSDKKLPDIEEFIKVTNYSLAAFLQSCLWHKKDDEHNPSCGRDRIEEMWPSYIP